MLASCAVAVLAAAGVQRVYASSPAGWGAGEISGFTVSDVHYALDAPDLVSGVSFRLDALATTVEVRLNSSDGWHECTVSGRNVTCAFTGRGVPVRSLQSLAVTAVA